MNRHVAKVLFASAFLSLTSLSSIALSEEGGDHNAMIAKAENAYKAINKTGGAWRDTGELIDEAKKEAESGNSQKAFELADEAYRQATLASEQQKNSGSGKPWQF
ncbi:MAG: hypothetical protein OEX00_00580 [Gammaproteobacteria bacterium]|nr:hypothetical protein [Gammaproteobacteria bacterium]MDH5692687.1 hypothetical protein [Gammaproteobacteria bacterium]